MASFLLIPCLLIPNGVFAKELSDGVQDDGADGEATYTEQPEIQTWSMDGDALPIIDDSKKCKLVIDYYDDLDADYPVTSAVFSVYKVAEMNEYGGFDSLVEGIDFGKAAGHEEEYCSDANVKIVAENVKPSGVIITNAKGHGELELEKGLYLVQENKPAQFHKESVPFLVQLPMLATDEDTNEYITNNNDEFYWNYTIRVMPKSKPTGNMMLTKFVEGGAGEKNRDFHFVITFEAEGEYEYQTTSGKTGMIKSGNTVPLKSGESIVIKDLPSGCAYEVVEVEANQDGYTTDYVNTNGAIVRFQALDVKIVNTKTPPPHKTGDIFNIYVIGGVAIVAFGIMLFIILSRKKSKKNDE